ncbi:TPA: hypothetical protein ACP2RM_003654 [Escherichia coli]
MADWFIATEGVKVVKDSADLWPQIITAGLTAGATLAGVWYGQWRTTEREKVTAAAKLASERLFIATELVFLLEQFAEGCAGVATDHGYVNQDGITIPETSLPDLDYASVSGDWRVLPATLMYRIRELPVLQDEADRVIRAADACPPEYDEMFEARQYQYTRLGLKAIIQARRLRKLVGYPETRLAATKWSAQPVLWKEWRLERKKRSVQARLRQQATAHMYVALNHSVKTNTISGDPE